MDAEEKRKKFEIALKVLARYRWIIFVFTAMIGTFLYLDNQSSEATPVDMVVDSEGELLDICNTLVVNNEVYPFLEVMGNGLKKANGAEFVAYKTPAELRSNVDIFNVDKLIFCGVPTELCYTENNDVLGGTYCINWLLEVPVFIDEFTEWYQKVS